jgi:hypothetical protein
MACPEHVGLLLSKYIDGEVSQDERARVEIHTTECPSCAKSLSTMRRNEGLLSDALAGRTFGDDVVEGVMRRIEQEDAPSFKRPQAVQRWWIPAAAAATLVLGLGAWWATRQALQLDSLNRSVAALEGSLDQAKSWATHSGRQVALLLKTLDEVSEIEHRRALEKFTSNHPSMTAAYVHQGVYVTSQFEEAGAFEGFRLYRRIRGEARFGRPLNETLLSKPEYMDYSAEPGVGYEYRFVGVHSDGSSQDGVVIPILCPGTPPEVGQAEVRCIEIGADDHEATFVWTDPSAVEPTANPTIVTVGGQLMGGPTGYVLERIEDGDEVVTATFAWPRLDDRGKPILDPSTGEIYVEYEDRTLHVRQNKRVTLRKGDREVTLWLHGRAFLPE